MTLAQLMPLQNATGPHSLYSTAVHHTAHASQALLHMQHLQAATDAQFLLRQQHPTNAKSIERVERA
jgi:hypothetical protein